MMKRFLICSVFLLSSPAYAECSDFVKSASQEFGVPESILNAIITVESSGQPYALNFNNERKAVVKNNADDAYKMISNAKSSNIDVGCAQINIKWHYKAFSSDKKEAIKMMLLPENNVRYAGYFLKNLQVQFGSWSKAVAHYHSFNPEHQKNYKQRVADVLKENTRTNP